MTPELDKAMNVGGRRQQQKIPPFVIANDQCVIGIDALEQLQRLSLFDVDAQLFEGHYHVLQIHFAIAVLIQMLKMQS